MEYALPHHIKNEEQLKYYEDYIKRDMNNIPQKRNLPACELETNIKSVSRPPLQSQNMTPRNNMMYGTAKNDMNFMMCIKNHIGKLIKVESLIGNCLESRAGVLLDVGADYVVIKLYRSNCTMVIPTSSIKYITIVHDNDMNKAGLY